MLCIRKIPVAKKFMDKRGGGVSRFPVEFFFVSQCRKFPWGEYFSISIISGIGNIYASESYVTISDFLSMFFCLTVPKNLVWGNPLVFH